MHNRPFCWLICAIILAVCHCIPASAPAEDGCQINLATMLVARDDTTIDPKLETHIAELQSMFVYSSYRLLGEENLTLATGQSGSVALPGGHKLDLTLQHIHDDRASLDLHMSRQGQAVFQTRIQLLNRGNLFVGGPKYLNGNLIFRISSAF